MNIPKTLEEAKQWKSTFWNEQPVMKIDMSGGLLEKIEYNDDELILDDCLSKEKNSYSLPKNSDKLVLDSSYSWTKDVDEGRIGNFLTRNYNTKRKYSSDFIKWCHKFGEYICLLRDSMIIGYVFYIKNDIQIEDKVKKTIDVQMLCVDNSYRKKGFMRKMIDNVKSMNLDYDIGIFSSEMYLGFPIISVSNYFKFLNVDKKFKKILKNIDKFKRPEKISVINIGTDVSFEKIDATNIGRVYKLYNRYMEQFFVHDIISLELFKKMLIESSVVCGYCVKNTKNKIIDFFIYLKYSMDIGNDDIKMGKVLMYTLNKCNIYNMVKYMMKVMTDNSLDAIEIANTMETNIALIDFEFNGKVNDINIYLYGWRCHDFPVNSISKLLL